MKSGVNGKIRLPMAVTALQNWGCNAAKPLWSSRLSIPSIINFNYHPSNLIWNFQTWKFHHASSVTVQANFWFSSVSTQRSNITYSDNWHFCFIVPKTGGCNLGMQLHPLLHRRTASLPVQTTLVRELCELFHEEETSRVVNIAILKVLQYYWQYFFGYCLHIANTI